jgi:hypothetical protein
MICSFGGPNQSTPILALGNDLPTVEHVGKVNFSVNSSSSHKKGARREAKRLISMVGREGFEPSTKRLKVFCSTD